VLASTTHVLSALLIAQPGGGSGSGLKDHTPVIVGVIFFAVVILVMIVTFLRRRK
jgi:hypothetical protein